VTSRYEKNAEKWQLSDDFTSAR